MRFPRQILGQILLSALIHIQFTKAQWSTYTETQFFVKPTDAAGVEVLDPDCEYGTDVAYVDLERTRCLRLVTLKSDESFPKVITSLVDNRVSIRWNVVVIKFLIPADTPNVGTLPPPQPFTEYWVRTDAPYEYQHLHVYHPPKSCYGKFEDRYTIAPLTTTNMAVVPPIATATVQSAVFSTITVPVVTTKGVDENGKSWSKSYNKTIYYIPENAAPPLQPNRMTPKRVNDCYTYVQGIKPESIWNRYGRNTTIIVICWVGGLFLLGFFQAYQNWYSMMISESYRLGYIPSLWLAIPGLIPMIVFCFIRKKKVPRESVFVRNFMRKKYNALPRSATRKMFCSDIFSKKRPEIVVRWEQEAKETELAEIDAAKYATREEQPPPRYTPDGTESQERFLQASPV